MENNEALKQFFTLLFKKVGEEIRSDTKNTCARYMEEELFPHTVKQKTFTRYYDRYINDEYVVGGKASLEFLNVFSKYLNYNSYAEFEAEFNETKIKTLSEENRVENENSTIEKSNKKIKEKWSQINQEESPKVVLADNALKKKKKK